MIGNYLSSLNDEVSLFRASSDCRRGRAVRQGEEGQEMQEPFEGEYAGYVDWERWTGPASLISLEWSQREEILWVHCSTVDPDFIVYMRAGGSSCLAN